ncbi:hypothetical protein WMF38_12805 [Sorangium sp. So ce118]
MAATYNDLQDALKVSYEYIDNAIAILKRVVNAITQTTIWSGKIEYKNVYKADGGYSIDANHAMSKDGVVVCVVEMAVDRGDESYSKYALSSVAVKVPLGVSLDAATGEYTIEVFDQAIVLDGRDPMLDKNAARIHDAFSRCFAREMHKTIIARQAASRK